MAISAVIPFQQQQAFAPNPSHNDVITMVGPTKTARLPQTVVDPGNGEEITIVLIPAQSGKSYSGHISGFFSSAGSDIVEILCFPFSTLIGVGSSQSEFVNEDFTCESLVITVRGHDGGPVRMRAEVQYVESSDITIVAAP
ncbi:MAG: hypothetical protein ACREBU_05100 [Nitrososphaera sp.]